VLWARIEADPATRVTVDLQAKQVTYADVTAPFEIDDYTRWRLLEGLDDVGLTERNLTDIETFEAARPSWLPKALPVV
jgi:3-isopropylmalate/(R)-2-methylmalate dehydratase small subunit